MTRRPSKEKFIEDWNSCEFDKKVMAELYGVSLQTIYNWIGLYVDEVEGNMEDAELSYYDYVEMFKGVINKPMKREFIVSLKHGATIVPISDVHLGSKFSNIPRLTEDLEIIAETPNVYAMFNGDLIDYATNGPQDLLYDQIFANPKFSRDWATKAISMIAHKMLAMVSGCHDDWYYKQTGEYLLESIAKTTITKIFSPDSLSLILKVGQQEYAIEMTHKLRHNSSYNISHGIFRKAARECNFDIGIVAHLHTPGVAVQNIRGTPVVAINCGGYKNLDTYAGKLGISPHEHWIPGFYVHADKHLIVPFPDWRMALTYMRGLE